MKNKFSLSDKEIATAAIQDAKNFGLEASLEEKDGLFEISFESKASYDSPKEQAAPTWDDYYNLSKAIYSEMQYQIKWVREEMSYAMQRFNSHLEGHLPAIKDAGKMQKAIDALGMSDSYEVRKQPVYVEW